MRATGSRNRPGFTLVELLTVIAIIVLLIGILIPALSSARRQAKSTATAGMIKSVGSGCEMFHGDFKHYPQSRGLNPFEDPGADISLMGAQWLALQLVGADSRGYVDPSIKNDSDDNRRIDNLDWNDWYALNPSRQYSRMGPYVPVDAKALRTPLLFQKENSDIPPPEALADDTEDWSNGRISFFVDAFGFPVIYYRANAKTGAPFTTGTPAGDLVVGQYDQADNAFFTGSDGSNGRWPISASADGEWWDLSGSGEMHPLGTFGYQPGDTDWPEPKTFASYVCDANIFETTDRGSGGRLWPHNADSFLLISPGPDALYGTADDVNNFAVGN